MFPDEIPEEILRLLDSRRPLLRRQLSYGSFVGVRYPYLYIETPKSACTTTKGHLWRLEGLGPLADPNDVHERPLDDPRPSLRTVPESHAAEAMRGTSVYRFCVWRDPVRRLASCYMAKIRLKRDPAREWDQYRRIIAKRFGLRSPDEITFEHFASIACAMPDVRREWHFMSQWRLSLSEFLRYDRIVRVDRYAEDMRAVYRDIGVPASEWPDFGTLRENFTGSESLEISQPVADMIRKAYARDYDMIASADPG